MNKRYGDVPKAQTPAQTTEAVVNKPMKAGQLVLNAELLGWLQEQLNVLAGVPCAVEDHGHTWEVEPVWDDDVAENAPTMILDELEKLGWQRYEDEYGDHAFVSTTYPASTPPRSTDELRFNVVLKNGVIRLDIRPWGQYSERGNGGGNRWNRRG